MTIIMNTGRVPLQVGVIQIKTGKKGTMRVMGRGRHPLMAGYKLDPNWLALYGKNIKIRENTPVAKTASSPAVTQPVVEKIVTPVVTTPAKTVTPAPTVSPTKGATT
jgi:hypothetical protein